MSEAFTELRSSADPLRICLRSVVPLPFPIPCPSQSYLVPPHRQFATPQSTVALPGARGRITVASRLSSAPRPASPSSPSLRSVRRTLRPLARARSSRARRSSSTTAGHLHTQLTADSNFQSPCVQPGAGREEVGRGGWGLGLGGRRAHRRTRPGTAIAPPPRHNPTAAAVAVPGCRVPGAAAAGLY